MSITLTGTTRRCPNCTYQGQSVQRRSDIYECPNSQCRVETFVTE